MSGVGVEWINRCGESQTKRILIIPLRPYHRQPIDTAKGLPLGYPILIIINININIIPLLLGNLKLYGLGTEYIYIYI